MIEVKEEWKWRYGPCDVNVAGKGWFQRQTGNDIVELEVYCAQRQPLGLLLEIKRTTLRAKVDTGAYRTVVSRQLFEKSGFRLPRQEASALRFYGIVQGPSGGSAGSYCLRGWENVPLRVGLLNYLAEEKLKFPTCELKVIVAENVSEHKFLLGLDFLQHFRVLLDRG